MLILFILLTALAVTLTRGLPFRERLNIFSRGAGNKNLLQMLWIFVLAGAFAESAKEMGAITAMVNLTLTWLPTQMVLVGLFVAACLVSIGIGTSVGTIVAIVPFATGLAQTAGLGLPMIVASVVGGALFGDNLSFISDTTVAATQTQEIAMRDKFRNNIRVALPVALLTALLYLYLGLNSEVSQIPVGPVDVWKILPYIYVLAAALAGLHVVIVLFSANLLTGLIGILTGGFDFVSWTESMTRGIAGMGDLLLISMIAGGLMELFKYNGGMDRIIKRIQRHVSGPRGAAISIAMLVSVVDLMTANNTIAILSVGHLSRNLADRYGLSRQATASILDTFSCCVQGLLPYGAQLLMAAGMSDTDPLQLLPYLFYPMLLFVGALLAILLFTRTKKCS